MVDGRLVEVLLVEVPPGEVEAVVAREVERAELRQREPDGGLLALADEEAPGDGRRGDGAAEPDDREAEGPVEELLAAGPAAIFVAADR